MRGNMDKPEIDFERLKEYKILLIKLGAIKRDEKPPLVNHYRRAGLINPSDFDEWE